MRRIVTFVFPLALGACASAPPALGPSAPAVKAGRPDVKAGDKYTYACTQGIQSYEAHDVITSVDESSIKFTQNGVLLQNTREANPIKEERFSHSDFRAFSFPLEVGKAWTFSDRWTEFDRPYHGTQKGNVTVVNYEKVRVPAGEFDAFKIQLSADWTSDAGASGRNTGRYWYAPRARTVVKSIINIAGEPELTCELTDFQLQP